MKLHNLLAKQNLHKAKRTPNKSKPIPTCVNEWWGIDMTKILTHSGWVYLVLVIDWFTKEIVGYELDYQSKTSHWQKALDVLVST